LWGKGEAPKQGAFSEGFRKRIWKNEQRRVVRRVAEVNRETRKRICVTFGLFALCAAALLVRTAYIQFIDGPRLKREATNQQTRDTAIAARRGAILDRNGKILAQSASTELVVAVPVEIKEAKNAEEAAGVLAGILEIDYDDVLKEVTKANSAYRIIKRRVEKETADKIREA
jgi:stage V sporulation protein D (sporulation-specific penicillin-binding protein)